jgi:D-glycerate 3-kinase
MGDEEFLLERAAGGTRPSASSCAIAVRLAREAACGGAAIYRPFVLGISGAQGSGKTTLAGMVRALLEEHRGFQVAQLSIDDFYLTKYEREALAREVHPLCATRGVAGTHDVVMMRGTLRALREAGSTDETPLPQFDKLADDRRPIEGWPVMRGRPDVVILEGWCVGLNRHVLGEWQGPINALERDEDPDGVWARWSASHLHAYEHIWQQIDLLAGILLPDIETVIQSRLAQERALVAAGGDPAKAMDEAAVRRFVAHYERHTRALWDAFPDIADLLIRRSAGFEYEILDGE